MTAADVVTVDAGRRLLFSAQALFDDPSGRLTAARLRQLIEKLGFVQIDSINVLARAQHLTLGTRLDEYRPRLLDHLVAQRALFEHWTHDAALIPSHLLPYWRHKFERMGARMRANNWFLERIGERAEHVMDAVLSRIEREGPLRTSHFHNGVARESGGWWSWTPEKAALEYLWSCGRLAVAGRRGFEKIYDLTERVLPATSTHTDVSLEEYVAWACGSAMERLCVATPAEVSGFWNLVTLAEARAWCGTAARDGRLVPVRTAGADGSLQSAFAVPDWASRAAAAEPRDDRMRLLCPFDPVVRDRKRFERLTGVHYRFEAFVPAAKRVHGYYVLPLLEGDTVVGRTDLKTHRAEGLLEVRGVWWERGGRLPAARRRRFLEALERLARQLGVARVTSDR